MRKIRVGKKLVTIAAIVAIGGGTTTFAMAYLDGSRFNPSGTTRDFQANQVVFSTEDSLTDGLDKGKQDDSELWEKEDNANSQNRPQANSAGGYLFDGSNIGIMDDLGTLTAQNDNAYPASSDDDNRIADTVYDFVNSTTDADMVLNNPNNKTEDNSWISEKPGRDETDDKSDLNGPKDNPSNSNPSKDDKPGTDNPGSNTSDDDKKNDNDSSSDDISSTIKDPKPVKKNEDYYWEPTKTPDYSDDASKDKDNMSLEITLNRSYQLYKGQTVTADELFCALNTYVIEVTGAKNNVFNLGSDQYDKFIRIDAVSFDGGKTYKEFPVTIPKDMGADQMVIKVEYRFSSASDEAWSERLVSYTPADSCIYVLSEKLDDGSDSIDENLVLNSVEMNQRYLSDGSIVNMLEMQSALWRKISQGEISDKLFTGWKENGEYVDYFYPVTTGRHILEPGDFVEINPQYKIKLKQYWMSDEYDIWTIDMGMDSSYAYNYNCYLQTFEYYDVDYSNYEDTEVLDIPRYVQAVDGDETWTSANRIKIPDTVLYINYKNDYLMIADGWDVDEDNLKYSSDDGILFDKDKTSIYGIPYNKTAVVVPLGVENVYIPEFNYIDTIDLRGRDASKAPQISFENLQTGCHLLLDEDQIVPYLEEYYEELEDAPDVVVAADASEDAKMYSVKNGAILSSDPNEEGGLTLEKVMKSGSVFHLPEGVDKISSKAFEDNTDTTILLLPPDSENIRMDKDSFKDSNISVIICCDMEQKENMDQFMDDNKINDIKVQLADTDPNGYRYLIESENGQEDILLLQAPEDAVEFDGTIEINGKKVTITSIGEEAFANNASIKFVTLPKEVTTIHARAFKGCSALEGILINATDNIVLGDGFIDNCYSLRYVASNAQTAEMENGYSPSLPGGIMLKPTNGTGYSDEFSWFGEEADVKQYTVISGGENGRFLYGVSQSGSPWLVIKGSSIVDEKTTLPVTTEEFLADSMEGTYSASETGKYTINWDEMTTLHFIDDYAFNISGLGGDLELPYVLEIGTYAFSSSGIDGKVHLSNTRLIGDFAFSNTAITEIYVDGNTDSGLSTGMGAFNSCSNLTDVVFKELNSIWYWTFMDCPNLSSVEIDATEPTTLIVSTTYGFQFTEADDDLTLKISGDSEEKNKAWIKAWRYPYMGYVQSTVEENFESLKLNVVWDLFDEGIMDPTDEEILNAAKEKILETENHLRKMLGMELITVDELDMSDELGVEEADTVSVNSLEAVSANSIYDNAISSQAADGKKDKQIVDGSVVNKNITGNHTSEENATGIGCNHTKLVNKKEATKKEITE